MSRSTSTPESRADAQLPHALPGERIELRTPAWRLSFYADGPPGPALAPPLVLVHSVNAAASAYEVRPIYEHFRRVRPVYALDLPGYGFSERAARLYSPRLMTDAVHALVREVRRRHDMQPVDALALSLSSEFLARAAVESPEPYRTLAFVSPTGFSRRDPRDGEPGTTRGVPWFHRAVTLPVWRRALFDVLTSRPSIRYFMQRTFGSKLVPPDLVDYAWRTARPPGAEHAPFSFLAGFLFSRDAARLYRAIRLPAWVCHGVRGDFTDYSKVPELARGPNWRVDVFQTGALPQFEMPDEFARRYEAFLS